MAKRPKLSLKEKLAKIREIGINPVPLGEANTVDQEILPLTQRIQLILNIITPQPLKADEMTYLIMYDISSDKVRQQIAKYLLSKGCIRVQLSVFMVRSENKEFQEIYDTLKDVNSYYENEDSIILVPVNASDVRSMKLIGKNVNISAVTKDRPNTLFF